MTDTFFSHRILNPITHKKLSKKSVFTQRIDIYSDLVWAKLGFVVTKWRHTVT